MIFLLLYLVSQTRGLAFNARGKAAMPLKTAFEPSSASIFIRRLYFPVRSLRARRLAASTKFPPAIIRGRHQLARKRLACLHPQPRRYSFNFVLFGSDSDVSQITLHRDFLLALPAIRDIAAEMMTPAQPFARR